MMDGSKHLIYSLGRSMSFGMLSLKAKALWPMMIAEADDQGRLDARAKPVKWGVCQNVDEITLEDIPELLQEMANERMILLYGPENQYAQILKWWEYQHMSYARESKMPAPEGWVDRVRYRSGETWVIEHWDCRGGFEPCVCEGYGRDTPIPTPMDTPMDSDKATEGKAKQTEGKAIKGNSNQGLTGTVAAADVDNYELNLQILEQLKIGNPKRRELAALSHVDPEYLREWRRWKDRKGHKTGAGFLVKQIEAGEYPE